MKRVNLLQTISLAAVRVYRALISPLLTAVFLPLGFGCRFTPTCSEYAAQAITSYGALRGTWLALRRLCRCHPWGGCGCDPLPARTPPVSGFALPVTNAGDLGAYSPTSKSQAARHR